MSLLAEIQTEVLKETDKCFQIIFIDETIFIDINGVRESLDHVRFNVWIHKLMDK